MQRREWLKRAGTGGMIALGADRVQADAGGSVPASIKNIVGSAHPQVDERVQLHVPADAANGAVVPVGVISRIPDTARIVLLVSEHSRAEVIEIDTSNPLLESSLSTHLQLLKPATITALVQSDTGWFTNTAVIKSLAETCES